MRPPGRVDPALDRAALPLWQGPSSPDARSNSARVGRPGEIARTALLRAPSRAASAAYGVVVTINPGWPVYTALAVLLAVTVVANRIARLGLARDAVVAAVRAVIQLTIAATVITFVIGSIWWSVAALVGMFVMAVITTCRRVEAPGAWPWAAAAMACGVAPVLAILLATRTIPIEGIALIPIVGIVLGNTMTVHTLVGRRSFAALREEKGQYEACLSLGMLPHQAIDEIIARRVPEGLMPSLDQVRTSGVVTLPGAFIGVMLGGGTAIQAATAQVLVLFAIMATQGITAGVEARLIRARRLVPTDLATSLVS